MAWLVGIVLALGVSAFARLVGLDHDRAFYPTVLAVIALLYDLFAAMGESTWALLVESAVAAVFLGAVALGFKRDLRIVVVALVAHGVFDLMHGYFIQNPGVPGWWPMFCLAYDATAGLCLAALLYFSAKESGSRYEALA